MLIGLIATIAPVPYVAVQLARFVQVAALRKFAGLVQFMVGMQVVGNQAEMNRYLQRALISLAS